MAQRDRFAGRVDETAEALGQRSFPRDGQRPERPGEGVHPQLALRGAGRALDRVGREAQVFAVAHELHA